MEPKELASLYSVMVEELNHRRLLYDDWAYFLSQITDDHAQEMCNAFYSFQISHSNDRLKRLNELIGQAIHSEGGADEYFGKLTRFSASV